MVEGARLESVYSGNAIAGSNPALSAEISYFRFKEIKKARKYCVCGLSLVQAYLQIPTFTGNSQASFMDLSLFYKTLLNLTQVTFY